MPPPPPPPPPPAQSSLPAAQPGRKNLLNEIEKGKRLKKTVTNDRSGPFIENKGGGQVTGNRTSVPSTPMPRPGNVTSNTVAKAPPPVHQTPLPRPPPGQNPGYNRTNGTPPNPSSASAVRGGFNGSPRQPPVAPTPPTVPRPMGQSAVSVDGKPPAHSPAANKFRLPNQTQPLQPPQNPVRPPTVYRASDDTAVKSSNNNFDLPQGRQNRSSSLVPGTTSASTTSPVRLPVTPVRPTHNGSTASSPSLQFATKLTGRSQVSSPLPVVPSSPQTQVRPVVRSAAQPPVSRFPTNGSAPPPPPPRGAAPPPLPPPRMAAPPTLPPPRQQGTARR